MTVVQVLTKLKGITLGSLFLFASGANAEPFSVNKNTLFYSTGDGTEVSEIDWGHEQQLLRILKEHREINTLVLKSEGGMIEVANNMADLVIDAELDTIVEENCESACVTIFLAGMNRFMEIGAKIGFHASWWSAEDMQSYYQDKRENEGWESPFEFASWLYEDTQKEIFKEFEYLLERGVQPHFAIQTLKAGSDGIWYPRRKELLKGGILTE